MKPKNLMISMAMIIFLLVSTGTVFPYHPEFHEPLTREAIAKSKLANEVDYLKTELGFENSLDQKLSGPAPEREYPLSVQTWIKNGSKWEDNKFAGGLTIRAPMHMHNPTRSPASLTDCPSWLLGRPSALVWARSRPEGYGDLYSWADANAYYHCALTENYKHLREHFFAMTFRGIGQVLHLLQDMAVPAHVRNDNHFHIPLPDGEEIEIYGSDLYDSHFCTAKIFPSFLSVINTAPVCHFDKFDDFFDSAPEGNTTTETGCGEGLAEYTNYNFVSDDTVLTSSYPHDHVHYFKYPNITSTNYTEHIGNLPWVRCEAEDGIEDTRGYLMKERHGETMDYFLAVGYLCPELWPVDPTLVLGLDDLVAYQYGRKLVPKAVGYSAGLIDYFFRGKIGITKKEVEYKGADVYDLTLEIKNESSYSMVDGTLVLMIKTSDVEGEVNYEELGNKSVSNLAHGDTLGWELANKVIDMPDYAEDDFSKIEFTLAYKGTLGQEDGVVGKVFTGVEGKATKYLHVSVVPNYVETDPDDNTQTGSFTISVQVYNYGSGGTTPEGGVNKKEGTQSYKVIDGKPVIEECYTDQVIEATKDSSFDGVVNISTLFSDISGISLYKEGWDGTINISSGDGNISGVQYKTDNADPFSEFGSVLVQAMEGGVIGNTKLEILTICNWASLSNINFNWTRNVWSDYKGSWAEAVAEAKVRLYATPFIHWPQQWIRDIYRQFAEWNWYHKTYKCSLYQSRVKITLSVNQPAMPDGASLYAKVKFHNEKYPSFYSSSEMYADLSDLLPAGGDKLLPYPGGDSNVGDILPNPKTHGEKYIFMNFYSGPNPALYTNKP